MAEYIEREAALAFPFANAQYDKDHANEHFIFGCESYKEWLEQLPAADVRPVVKAKWVYTDMSRLVCSNCGNPVAFALKKDGWHHGDFCPNCGADMRECE